MGRGGGIENKETKNKLKTYSASFNLISVLGFDFLLLDDLSSSLFPGSLSTNSIWLARQTTPSPVPINSSPVFSTARAVTPTEVYKTTINAQLITYIDFKKKYELKQIFSDDDN